MFVTGSSGSYTRVAVVQLAYHPAIVMDRRSPLEDPLFDPARGDSLLPSHGQVPEALREDVERLRARIRAVYNQQLLGKIRAVLSACLAWKVQIIVFPEYSIPWDILSDVAEAAGDMVVVAGTHTVDRAAKRSGIYGRLVASTLPAMGQSVCPVLHRGKLLALVPKLNPAAAERASMLPGNTWAPVAMPEGLPGPMGVLVCLDFLFREGDRHPALVAEPLKGCRFLAVPSLTPHYTLPEFAGKAWEEARRYGRPVLYCDGAAGGGTALYVDEGAPRDLRRFPGRAGYLDPGDEGVIVADVNLGYERPGGSTRYEEARPLIPVAEASLVYGVHPATAAYARWLEEASPLLARDDEEALDGLVMRIERDRDLLLDAGALTGATARGRRLRRLTAEIDNVTSVEEIRQFTREIVVPGEFVPLSDLRSAMAGAAGDVVFAWLKRTEARSAGFGEVEERLRKTAEEARESRSWTSEATAALGVVAQAVRGAPEATEKTALETEERVKIVLPSGIDPAALGIREHEDWVLSFKLEPSDLRANKEEARPDKRQTARTAPGSGLTAARGEDVDPSFTDGEIDSAQELFLLALAEGAERVATVSVWPKSRPSIRTIVVVSSRSGEWTLWTDASDPWIDLQWDQIQRAFLSCGLAAASRMALPFGIVSGRISALLPRFDAARSIVRALREQRLREVDSQFVTPDARVDGGEPEPVLAALDTWLASDQRTALVLGEFGSGKSTALAEWAHGRWERGDTPRVLLVNLASASSAQDPEALLLDAAGVTDTPAERAALQLLIRHYLVIPCFDGFDEMATRLDASELVSRLSGLLAVARGGGKVIVSSRNNYFPNEAHLATTTATALSNALGESAGIRRMVIQPFSDEQVAALIRKIKHRAGDAEEALDRISRTYDLRDLVHRPLLLGMVLATLDDLAVGSKVGRADLYEAYLKRWLDQTRSSDPDCFTDEQKKQFAESLAEQLWRSGQPSCSWQELQQSVRARLAQHLPETMPLGAAFLEIQGGAFFVHEGEDRYRFAHKSFLEYFLARGLVSTVQERPMEALLTRSFTPEVAAFLGEILRRDGDPRVTATVGALKLFLIGRRNPLGAPFQGRAGRRADPAESRSAQAANALRVLLGLSRWATDRNGWIPEGADLRRVDLIKEDLRGASLFRADLDGADLSGADLSEADLTGATLDEARLLGVKLDRTVLTGVKARGANFTHAEADRANLDGADLSGSVLRQSMWTACQWSGSQAEDAEVTGWAAPGSIATLEGAHPIAAIPPQVVIALGSGHFYGVDAVAWSPDGTRLASAGDDGTVRLWGAATGRELARFNGHRGGVTGIGWSPDGLRLVSAGADATVRTWDVATGREVVRFKGHEGAVNGISWSPDGRRLASAGDDATVRTWDAVAGHELVRVAGHAGKVNRISWSPDGLRLASAGNDATVRMWDATTGHEIARFDVRARRVRGISWSPDGTRLASTGDHDTVRLWDAATGSELSWLVNHRSVNAVAWSPDGQRLASAGAGSVRLWDVATGREVARLIGSLDGAKAVSWSPDGTCLASAEGDATVRLWDTVTGRELARFDGCPGATMAVSWSSDGTRLAGTGRGNSVQVWDTATGHALAHLSGHTAGVNSVAWSPDTMRLASAGHDGTVRLWDAATGRELARLDGHTDGVRSVSWSPDGTRLASAGDDVTVRRWDAATGHELARLDDLAEVRDADEHPYGGDAISWSPDGTRLACAAYNGTVQLWDAATGREVARLDGHEGIVRSVSWSPDGARLASAGQDRIVRLWDAAGGVEIVRLEGHRADVLSVSWSADGTRLASGGSDGTIRLWDTVAGCQIARLDCRGTDVSAVSWSPDGARLASAGDDRTVRLWDVSEKRIIAIFESIGEATITRTPGGFCLFGDKDPDRARLALRRPEPGSRTVLYLPLAGLREVLHRPDKIAAALAGDLSGDDVHAELERLGYANGVIWDGEEARIPPRAPPDEAPVKPTSSARATLAPAPPAAPAQRAASPAPSAAPAPPPPLLKNPFRPGPALIGAPTLPGREHVLSDLLALILGQSPAILRGPRRSGKTSILHHLAARLASTHRIRHVTLEAQRIVTPDDLARVLEPSLSADPTPADTLRTRLRDEDAAVLLIDEIANLGAADSSVFAWLRAVGQERTSVVLVGAEWDWVEIVEHAASAPGSSFGNDVTPVTLGPLREVDALAFLAATAPPDVPIARDGTGRWIVERCGTWPFYLQVMGYAVVQAVRAGERRALVEPVGVTELYEERLLLERDIGFFRARWRELPERAQRILWKLRASPSGAMPVIRELAPQDRRALRDTGLCDGLERWLDDRPFYDWIRRIAGEDERTSR